MHYDIIVGCTSFREKIWEYVLLIIYFSSKQSHYVIKKVVLSSKMKFLFIIPLFCNQQKMLYEISMDDTYMYYIFDL